MILGLVLKLGRTEGEIERKWGRTEARKGGSKEGKRDERDKPDKRNKSDKPDKRIRDYRGLTTLLKIAVRA
jgi:hypothetical protein